MSQISKTVFSKNPSEIQKGFISSFPPSIMYIKYLNLYIFNKIYN